MKPPVKSKRQRRTEKKQAKPNVYKPSFIVTTTKESLSFDEEQFNSDEDQFPFNEEQFSSDESRGTSEKVEANGQTVKSLGERANNEKFRRTSKQRKV